jgi:hypothetical protein
MREQKPEVRNKLMKQRSLKTKEEEKAKVAKGLLEKELDEAIEYFQPQFKAPA